MPPQPQTPGIRRISPWPDVASLRELIGGYVEIRYDIEDGWHLYCIERGQQSHLTLNLQATELVRQADKESLPVYGTAVVVGTGVGGMDIDVPEDVALRVLGHS
jgi:hypothetical protein